MSVAMKYSLSQGRPGALALGVLALMSMGGPAQADVPTLRSGPVFTSYGDTYPVDADVQIPADAEFKVAFDVSEAARGGEVNRKFNSVARFINMHVAAGVPFDHIHIALVVHGAAGKELLDDAAYAKRESGAENANAPLIRALLAKGVRVILCGQSAAGMGLDKADLIPGVELALSAMTAHALLQQDGYTLNPS